MFSTMVTPEMASKEQKWWYDDRYAIYDLSVNSAIAYPQHNDVIKLSTAEPMYAIKGYAYGGGGRRITRVEVSLDKGRSTYIVDSLFTTSPMSFLTRFNPHSLAARHRFIPRG